MSTTIATRTRTIRGPMLIGLLLIEIGKRLGLAKPIVRLMFRRMSSRSAKQRAFAGYQPTARDVVVATFGKSGTNWMMQIAQQIAYRGEAEFDHIHDMVPWPDSPGPVAVSLTDTKARDESPTGLRVIKTHLETEFVPYHEKAVYLTVIRDPKEVVVSSYHFLGGIFNILTHITIDDWFDVFMKPESLARAWAIHTASFWDWRDRPNVLVLSYSELKSEPRRCIERVASLMGVALSEAELAVVAERSSFEYMKEHESQFAPPRSPFAKEADAPVMIRRGRTGATGELLSHAQQVAIDQRCEEELRELGSDFRYTDVFTAAGDSPAGWPSARKVSQVSRVGAD